MNFDDLHDPEPPRPGMGTLASVAGRARQIRRRRVALVATGSVLASAIVVVPLVLAATGDESGERLVPATAPAAPTTTAAPSVEPSPSAAPTATVTTTVVTAAQPLLATDVVAIRTDGDAVRIATDGSQTLLYDGADPRVQPEEGELTIVDSVVATPDGNTFVSTCCEPVPGSWSEISDADGFGGYGHGLQLSPDGTRIALSGASLATLIDTAGQVVAELDSTQHTPEPTQIEQAMWLADDQLALLLLQEQEFSVMTTTGSFASLGGGGSLGAFDPIAPFPQLAGVGADGSILVFQAAGDPAAATVLQAYDAGSWERQPDVALPAPATYAWVQDDVLTWIGTDGSLHVGDTVVPGEFRWARPVR